MQKRSSTLIVSLFIAVGFFAHTLAISDASAVTPHAGASLVFAEAPRPGSLRLSTYEWDSNIWKRDGALFYSTNGPRRIIPFPGAREFAALEDRLGGGLVVKTISSRGVQISSPAKALGHTRDGYPLELTAGDSIIEYTSPQQEQTLLYTNPASLPVWGTGSYHQIGQLKDGQYVLAGDQVVIAFDPAQMTKLKRVDLGALRFETKRGSGVWPRVTRVLELLPAEDARVWFLVDTNKGRQSILLVDLETGKLCDHFVLSSQHSRGVTLANSIALISSSPGFIGDDLVYREGRTLKQRDATTGSTVVLTNYFDTQELARYGIPQTLTSNVIGSPVAWNWKAQFYSYTSKIGARAAAALAAPLLRAPLSPAPNIQPVTVPAMHSAAPVVTAPFASTPFATPPLFTPPLLADPIEQMPEQLTRKAFLAYYRHATSEFKAAFQTLLSTEGENALRRLGFARYYTTIEITGDESAVITRAQVQQALAGLCSKALQN